MVGGAGNAPVVTSDSCLRHRFYRPAAGTPPKLVAGVGVAPGHPPWRGDILLLNYNREIIRAGSNHAPGPCHFNKEQTPLAILRYQPTVSRWFFRCLGAHLLRSP